jgi:serine/threonine protein kinase
MRQAGESIGSYRVVQPVRETEACEYYLCEQTASAGQLVGVQLWPGVHLSDQSASLPFISWSSALSSMHAPALLPVSSGDLEGDTPYLVLGVEAVSPTTETLGARLARQASEPLSPARRREIVAQIGHALVAAHARGLVHGQLSPESVLLMDDGRVLLANFKPPFAGPEPAALPYQPPEEGASERGDQFALARLAERLLGSDGGALSLHEGEALRIATSANPDLRFLSVRAFLTALDLAESAPAPWQMPVAAPRLRRPRIHFTPRVGRIALGALGGLLLLLLLIFGGDWLYSILPATSATVSIAPIPQGVSHTYTFSLAQSDNFAQFQVQSRHLKYTTSTQRETVASSVTHAGIAARHAHGQLVFSSVSRDVEANVLLSIQLENGLVLNVNDHGPISSQHATTVDAEVQQAGSQSNIPADFVDGTYDFMPVVGNPAPFTAYISNPRPFTGGADAYNGPVVQQDDVEQTQNDLKMKLTQEARQKIRAMLQPGEDLLPLGADVVDCAPHVQANHRAGDRAASVTVSEHLDCQGVAYDAQGTLNWVTQDMQQQATHLLGPHFARLGALKTVPSLGLVQATQFLCQAYGQWALQLDAAGRRAVAQGISGLAQDAARDLLLKKFHARVHSLRLASLWGRHLPTDASAISIVALPPQV